MTKKNPSVFAALIGRKVRALLTDSAHEVLVFVLDAAPSVVAYTEHHGTREHVVTAPPPTEAEAYEAVGDCCSESWFHHCEGIDALIGGTVREVHDIDSGCELIGPSTRQDVDCVYFFTIVTDKGRCTIEMRNSSNGCYGGEVCHVTCGAKFHPEAIKAAKPAMQDW